MASGGKFENEREQEMRNLDDVFLKALRKGGYLHPLLDAVKSDPTLCLELRGKSANIYYRGGNLMRIEQLSSDDFILSFDENYFAASNRIDLPDSTDVNSWIEVAPKLKRAMDQHLGKHRNDEREFQQLLLRENNYGCIARSTDYYICDIEYQNESSRFDLIAVHWPSKSSKRKKAEDRRLVFIEMKYGDGALDGSAGIKSHIEKVNKFLSDPGKLGNFKKDMVAVFNQKRDLELLDCGKNLESFSDEQPLLLLVFANHDPEKSGLRSVLANLSDSPHAELRVATASFMGYGLYDQGIHTIDEARRRFSDYIYCP